MATGTRSRTSRSKKTPTSRRSSRSAKKPAKKKPTKKRSVATRRPRVKREVLQVEEHWSAADLAGRWNMPGWMEHRGRAFVPTVGDAVALIAHPRRRLDIASRDGAWYAAAVHEKPDGGAVIWRYYVEGFTPDERLEILHEVRERKPELVVIRSVSQNRRRRRAA